jgi:hypothetical protein
VVEPVAKADPCEGSTGAGLGIGKAAELHGNGDILDRRERGDEVEGLEDNADGLAADSGQRLFRPAAQFRTMPA